MRRVAVIGAGAAGSSAAHRLAARGFDVTVFERAGEPAQGASGNLAGVFRPLPSQDDSRLSRLLRDCYLYGKRHIENLPGVRHDFCGVLHVARDERHEATQRRVVVEQQLAPDFCRFVERDEAVRIAGWPVAMGGWWFPGGGWVNPPSLCRANLAGIDVRYDILIDRIERRGDVWQLLDATGATLFEADHVVLANACDTRRMVPDLPVRIGRGQVSHLPEADAPAFKIVATRVGYVTPAVDGVRCFGATLATGDPDLTPRVADHAENLARLEMTLPGFGKGIDPARLNGRVGLRPMSPDRLPIVGALDTPGLWTINGFGARGLVWSALCAALLAARMAGDTPPLAADLAAAIDPLRFRERLRRRGKV